MKRIVSLLLAALLVFSSWTFSLAETVETQYESTRLFLSRLDKVGIPYAYYGINENNREVLEIENTNYDLDITYTISLFFHENNENADMYVWNLLTYDPSEDGFFKVLQACNACNASWNYAKFYADTSDHTVSVDANMIFRGDSAGEVCYEGLLHLVSVISKVYEEHFAPLAQ